MTRVFLSLVLGSLALSVALPAYAAEGDLLQCTELEAFEPFTVDVDASCSTTRAPGVLDPVVKWGRGTFATFPEYNQVMVTPMVMHLNDDDGGGGIEDGGGVSDLRDFPDVVFTRSRPNNPDVTQDGVLTVLNGANGAELWSSKGEGTAQVSATGGVAMGDLDGNGRAEVCVTLYSGGQIACWEVNLAGPLQPVLRHKWTSNACPASTNGNLGYPAIADLDGDGKAEVILNGVCVLNFDGTLRAKSPSELPLAIGYMSRVPFAADMDDDPALEIVVGPQVFDMDDSDTLVLKWQLDGVGNDAIAAVADIDGDGRPEHVVADPQHAQVVVASDGVVLWRSDIIGAVSPRGGAPTIADFDNDGAPEIGVAGDTFYVVFDGDGDVLWTKASNDTSSRVTSSSVFDFDGDGAAEVLYADEDSLYLLDGATGAERAVLADHASATFLEYPTIADIDSDASSDIILTSNNWYKAGWNGVRVISSATRSWRPSRPVWNQHAYSISNIDDFGAVPRAPIKNWERWNNFRAAAQEEGLPQWQSDLYVVDVVGCQERCLNAEGVVALDVIVANRGLLDASNVKVALRRNTADGELLAETDLARVDSGISARAAFLVTEAEWGDDELVAVVRVGATTAECDATNNSAVVGLLPQLQDDDQNSVPDVCDACTAPGTDVCDGVDNDCDGLLDEDSPLRPTECGVGRCEQAGWERCLNGRIVDTCIPGQPFQSPLTFESGYDGAGAGVIIGNAITSAPLNDEYMYTGWQVDGGVNDSAHVYATANPMIAYGTTIRAYTLGYTRPDGEPFHVGGRLQAHFKTTGGQVQATNATPATARARWYIVTATPRLMYWAMRDDSSWNPNDDLEWTEHGVDLVFENFQMYYPWVGRPGTRAEFEDTVVNAQWASLWFHDATLVVAPNPNPSRNTGPHFGLQAAGDAPVYLGMDDLTYIAPSNLRDDECNGVDDNCDGDPDEAFVGQVFSCGVGECARTITQTCEEGAVVGACVAGEPGIEICDGKDNNCNQQVDEGFVELLGVDCDVGLGECFREGETACDASGGVSCNAAIVPPGTEICDGLDNDCDGTTDALDGDLVAVLCDEQRGVCAGSRRSVAMCVQGAWQACGPTQYGASYDAADAVCNGQDNDCDGSTDEGYVAPPTSCGVGVCAGNVGVMACQGGVVRDTCDPLARSSAERCNNLDDDCDGTTDEGFALSVTCEVGQGACHATGVTMCAATGDGTMCSAIAGTPVAERCDAAGVDENCDGVSDVVHFGLGEVCAVGVGACRREGTRQCVAGAAGCSATAGTATTEVCDGVDNDCDGDVDEDAAGDSVCAEVETIASEVAAVICEASVTIAFETTGTSAECRVDAGAWSLCAEPAVTLTGLAAGTHVFEVRGRDVLGNVDGTPAQVVFEIDLTTPAVQLALWPDNPSPRSGARFAFAADDTVTSFECALTAADASEADIRAATVSCTSPFEVATLGNGAHTFHVRANGTCGVGAWTSYTWTVDVSEVTPCNDIPLRLDCDAHIERDAPADVCGWQGTVSAEATDACAVDTALIHEDNFYAVGTQPVTFRAANGAGQTATCVTELVISDVTDPTVACGSIVRTTDQASARATAADACTAALRIDGVTCLIGETPVATEDCSAVVEGDTIVATATIDGPLTVTYVVHATDPSGNTSEVDCTLDLPAIIQPEPEPEAEVIEPQPEPEPEVTEPEPEAEVVEPEPQPEAEVIEPEPQPEVVEPCPNDLCSPSNYDGLKAQGDGGCTTGTSTLPALSLLVLAIMIGSRRAHQRR